MADTYTIKTEDGKTFTCAPVGPGLVAPVQARLLAAVSTSRIKASWMMIKSLPVLPCSA
jgi:hypothetical protein